MPVGSASVANYANTSAASALGVVADVAAASDVGLNVGGNGVAALIGGVVLSFLLIETGVENYLLQESGTAPTRIQLE